MSSPTHFHLVSAFTKDFIIGVDGKLPCRSPEDMRFFRNLTMHKAVLMGYNTFASIGRYLPGRVNVILDRNVGHGNGVRCIEEGVAYHAVDLSSAVEWLNGRYPDVYVIGGEKTYLDFLTYSKHHPYVDLHSVYLTRIHPSAILPGMDGKKVARFPIEKLFHENTHSIQYKLDMAYTSVESKNEYMVYSLDPVFHNRESNKNEFGYLNLLEKVLREGELCEDRTGVGTLSIFGHQLEFDLSEGTLPLLTTKRVFLKGVVHELLWFLRGETDSKILEREGVGIWKGNTSRAALDRLILGNYAEGEGGPIYGHQFRHFGAQWEIDEGGHRRVLPGGHGVDQVEEVLELLRTAPHSRRIMINLWNPVDLDEMALPPCHVLYQFRVYNGKLSCSMYQRSCDTFLGLPFNICSTALMTYIFAHLTGLTPGKIVMSFGDVHIYQNHLEAVQKQLCNRPFPFPKLMIEPRGQQSVEEFVPSDFVVSGYLSHGAISAPMAV